MKEILSKLWPFSFLLILVMFSGCKVIEKTFEQSRKIHQKAWEKKEFRCLEVEKMALDKKGNLHVMVKYTSLGETIKYWFLLYPDELKSSQSYYFRPQSSDTAQVVPWKSRPVPFLLRPLKKVKEMSYSELKKKKKEKRNLSPSFALQKINVSSTPIYQVYHLPGRTKPLKIYFEREVNIHYSYPLYHFAGVGFIFVGLPFYYLEGFAESLKELGQALPFLKGLLGILKLVTLIAN